MPLINKKPWEWDSEQDPKDDWDYAYAQKNPTVPVIITKKRMDKWTRKMEYEVGLSGIWFTERDGVYERATENGARVGENEFTRGSPAGAYESRMSTSDQTALLSRKPSCMGPKSRIGPDDDEQYHSVSSISWWHRSPEICI